MPTFEILADAAALEALEPAWWDLWRRCPRATPFQSPAWLLPWWESFAPGLLATMAVFEDAKLVALAPLYRHVDEHGDRLLPVGVSLSDYGDVLADPAEPGALPALSDALAASPVPRIVWPDLRPGAAALQLPSPPGWPDARRPGQPCPVLDLPHGSEGLATVPGLQQRKWRMAGHRAERRGGAAFQDLDQIGADAFLAVLETLHRRRQHARGEAGIFADPRVRTFLGRALARLHAAGLADAAILRIGGEPAGAYLGLRDATRAYAYCGGFSERFARESPGTLLVGRAIAEAVARGAGSFHFLRGGEAYKYAWGAVDRFNVSRELGRG